MHMLKKNLIAGQPCRTRLRQIFFSVAEHQVITGARLRQLPDGRVDARVGAERQRVGVARDLKFLRRVGVRQC